MSTKTYTEADLFHAEQACQMAHRKLGMRKDRNAATASDYRKAELAARKLERIAKAIKRTN